MFSIHFLYIDKLIYRLIIVELWFSSLYIVSQRSGTIFHAQTSNTVYFFLRPQPCLLKKFTKQSQNCDLTWEIVSQQLSQGLMGSGLLVQCLCCWPAQLLWEFKVMWSIGTIHRVCRAGPCARRLINVMIFNRPSNIDNSVCDNICFKLFM